MPATLDFLTETATDELLDLLNLGKVQRGRGVLRTLFKPVTRVFSRQALDFDQQVGEFGWRAAAAGLLKRFVKSVEVRGAEYLPAHGPLWVVANHPGMTDFLAMFSALPRRDLRIVAGDRPFLRALPHVTRDLIYVTPQPGVRMAAVRQILRHLEAAGAVFSFPSGRAEPDPALLPGAEQMLEVWSPSLALGVRQVPETQVVPALIYGVMWSATLNSPFARLRQTMRERIRVGGALQIIAQVLTGLRPVQVVVQFSPAIPGAELAAGHNLETVMQPVRQRMRSLLAEMPAS